MHIINYKFDSEHTDSMLISQDNTTETYLNTIWTNVENNLISSGTNKGLKEITIMKKKNTRSNILKQHL